MEGWGWIALAVVVASFLFLWFAPVQVAVRFHQQSYDANLAVEVSAPLLRRQFSLNVSDTIAMALEHMWKRWQATGEPVKIPLQKSIRRLPRRKLIRALALPMSFLAKRARCTRLVLGVDVGGYDAMESALLAGLFWSVLGWGVGLFSRKIRMARAPVVQVVPNYGEPAWRAHADCILRLRLGHAIVAGVWIIRRILSERELLLWARDSLRRKGVEDDGRPSDSRPDEDGHGEPEGHGGRERSDRGAGGDE